MQALSQVVGIEQSQSSCLHGAHVLCREVRRGPEDSGSGCQGGMCFKERMVMNINNYS